MDLSGIGPALTLLGTFGGIWVVAILFRWFQRDFAAAYRDELREEREKREAAETALADERRARWAAESEAARLRAEAAGRRPDPPAIPHPQD